MAERATYVYCVVKAAKRPRLAGAPSGLAHGGPVRALDVDDGYHALVSSVPLPRYAATSIDERLRDLEWVGARAAEHERVVEHFTRAGTLVPMKLFTLFASDERAIAHLARSRRTLDRAVARIEGCDEWGLRVLFDEVEAARAAAESARASKPASGAGFLARKKAEQDARRTLTADAGAEVDALYARLSALARRAVRRAAPNRELTGRVLLDGVFLVPRARVRAFKGAVGAVAEPLSRRGFHVTLSGPWPAYSFIGAR